jgi:methyltransferase, FkbM family
MLTGFRNRLGLFADFATKRDFHVSLPSLVHRATMAPAAMRGPRLIRSLERSGDHFRVELAGQTSPLFWPAILPISQLHAVISECFYSDDWHYYEAPETPVSEGDVVIDCGAAEGSFALKVADRARIVAVFEPLPLFLTALRRTFATRPNVLLEPSALGARPDTAYLDGAGICASLTAVPTSTVVRVTTVDEWSAATGQRVDFVKADVEGYELDVLRGASEVIRRDRPKLAITTYHLANDWRRLADHIRSLAPGYQFRVKGMVKREDGIVRPVMLHAWHAE